MTMQPYEDLFAIPSAAGGQPCGSAQRTARRGRTGGGAASAAGPFLTLPRLLHSPRAVSNDPAAPPAPPPQSENRPILSLSKDTAAAGSFVPVAAMEAVLALRVTQIHTHGHTLDADLALIARTGHRHAIAKLAANSLHAAIEDMMFGKPAAQVRRRLTKAAALILAAMDAEEAVEEGANHHD